MNHEGDNDKGTNYHAEPSEYDSGRGADENTAIVESGKPPPNPPDASDKQTRGERYFYLGTQAALVVVAGIGIAIAICTLRSLNQSVIAQTSAVEAARKANEIAQQTLETEARAYISIENARVIQFGIGRTPRFTCILRNTGHVPATRIVLVPTIGFGPPYKGKGPRPISRGDFFTPAPEDAGDILAPGESKPFDYEIKNFMPPPMATKRRLPFFDLRKMMAGQQELSVLAAVAYYDGFGHARTSWKNLRYDPYFHTFVIDSSHES